MSEHASLYVTEFIEGDPTIKVGLQRGLITSRVLTKHIIEEERRFKGSFDDVRNAVRKYASKRMPLNLKSVYTVFKDSYVEVRSNLSCIHIKRDANAEVFNLFHKFFYFRR